MNENQRVLTTLTQLGKMILDPILEDKFPSIKIPDRGTSNIVFDKEKNRFVLGSSTSIRNSSNIKHIRSLTQLTWVAAFAKQLTESSRTSSLRDLYYSSEAFGIDFTDHFDRVYLLHLLENFMTEVPGDFIFNFGPHFLNQLNKPVLFGF